MRGVRLLSVSSHDYAPDGGDRTTADLWNLTPICMAGAPEEARGCVRRSDQCQATPVFDVVALPSETPLIKAARGLGFDVITGAQVLSLQAAEHFERYTVVRPTALMYRRRRRLPALSFTVLWRGGTTVPLASPIVPMTRTLVLRRELGLSSDDARRVLTRPSYPGAVGVELQHIQPS